MSSEPGRFLGLVRDLGAKDGLRIALGRLGVQSWQSLKYPGIGRTFRVQFDPTWRWIERGIREAPVIRFFEENVRGGQTVLDIGAHLGEYSLLSWELVGQTGKVFAFEPDPRARLVLARNLKANSAANVDVEVSAASDANGRARMTSERLGNGRTALSRGSGEGRQAVEVETVALDDWCKGRGLVPEWVKVDVEGAEATVFRGMSGLIANGRTSVIAEFHSAGMSETARRNDWQTVTKGAREVVYLHGDYQHLRYLEELSSNAVPGDKSLVVCIRY